jgi:hypothetical protein
MTIPELGDAVKAAFKAGAFQTDAYAPFSSSPTFRVGDMKLSADSGVVLGRLVALAGIDPQNPAQLAPPALDDQLRGFYRDDPVQPWFVQRQR